MVPTTAFLAAAAAAVFTAPPLDQFSIQGDGDEWEGAVAGTVGLSAVEQFSIAFFAKRLAANDESCASGWWLNAASTLQFTQWNDGLAYFDISDGVGRALSSYASNDTDWHSWVWVYEGTLIGDAQRLKLYLDGSQVVLAFIGQPIPPVTQLQTSPWRFLSYKDREVFTIGNLTQYVIFGDALSPTEASQFAAGTLDIAALMPLSWWKCSEGAGLTAADSGSNGLSATLESTGMWSNDVPGT